MGRSQPESRSNLPKRQYNLAAAVPRCVEMKRMTTLESIAGSGRSLWDRVFALIRVAAYVRAKVQVHAKARVITILAKYLLGVCESAGLG